MSETTMIPLDKVKEQWGGEQAAAAPAPAEEQAPAPAEDVRGGRPSASGLARLVACPASWMAEQLAGEDEESEAARHGTELHRHMELGTVPEDADDAEAVEWCRETELALADRCLQVPQGMMFVERERRLWDSRRKFSGQADAVFLDAVSGEQDLDEPTAALVVDYKFGRGVVAGAERNYQLAALAHLVGERYPSLQVVFAAILQPFASRGEPRVVRYSREALAAARDAIYAAIDTAERPGAEFRPGEMACRYCKAAKTCPACSGHTACLTVVQRWDELAPAARSELYRRAKLAGGLAEKIEAAVRRDLERGVELPGLSLGAGSKKFTVTDAGAAFGIVSRELGVTPDEFTGCCKVQISQLDKVVHAKFKERNPKQTQASSKESLRELLAGCAEMKQSAGSIKEVNA